MVGRSVDEIIALAGSDRLLAGLVDPDPSWLIVDDLDEAWRWASKVPIPVEVPNVGSNLNWLDFRSIGASPLGSKRPGVATAERRREISVAIRAGFDLPGVGTSLRSRFRKHWLQQLLGDTQGDLANAARFAASADGIDSLLFERVVEGYFAGGWPCGWDGPFPDGRLVVFVAGEQPVDDLD